MMQANAVEFHMLFIQKKALIGIKTKGAQPKMLANPVLLSEAFQELLKGNVDKHNEMLIKAVNELSEEVDSIVLAQLSMSALAPLLTDTKVPVFNSGATAFPRIRQMLEQMD